MPLQAPAGHHCPIVIITMAMMRCCWPILSLSWLQHQEMAPMTQGVCIACTIAADNIAPCGIDASGARCWWGRWRGRHGRGDGAKKGYGMNSNQRFQLLAFEAQSMASKDRSLPHYTNKR
eukprot:15346614-Ditylum_brightwellii.AAC.1